jgi:hypothetical protein
MKFAIPILAMSLTGCSAVTVYFPEAPPSQRCMIVAPVKYSLFIPVDAPDQGVPLGDLRDRVLNVCKEEARDAGANALLITDRSESDSAGRKGLIVKCSGMAYICP